MEKRRKYRSLKRKDSKELFRKLQQEQLLDAINLPSDLFYKCKRWKEFRFRMLQELGNRCMACGASPSDGVAIQVDHIKPRWIFPELAFNPKNIQILCRACNFGKGLSRTNVKRTFLRRKNSK